MNRLLRISQKVLLLAVAVSSLSSCLDECDIYLPTDSGYLSIDIMISTNISTQYAYVRRTYDNTITPDTIDKYDWNYRNDLYFKPVDCEVILIDEETKKEYKYERKVTYTRPLSVRYELDNFLPIVGRTYTAKVICDGKVYQSTQTLRKAPTVDKVMFKPYQTLDEKEGRYRPFLFLSDPTPEEIDYCLFYQRGYHEDIDSYSEFPRCNYETYSVPMTLYSDDGMKDIDGGIEFSLGIGAYENDKFTGVGYTFDFEVLSMSEENFEFFKEYEKQITTDGGVYTPCPVSPPTNFSGERVMGQFIATDLKIYRFEATKDNIYRE
ncbi:MAG: hypothetical protein Q4C30_10025 [Bacteroidia bacterium]|nr:hypothetical protein [Bacteroidia bacterium]